MGLQRKRVANAERVRELVDSAFATRYHDIEGTLKTASQAVALAEEARSELSADLIAAAWTEYGNALRLTGRYEESERALDRAGSESISDIPTKAHLFEVKASLYRNTRRFEGAINLLQSAIGLQRSIGDSAGEARHNNHMGIVYLDSGDPERALCVFQTALDLFGIDAPTDVLISTGHNMVEAMIAAGRLAGATAGLAVLEPYHRGLTSVRLAAKSEWLRARLCLELRQPSAAKLAFERAHKLLINEPRSPELSSLVKEMAELEAQMARKAKKRGTNQAP
jgi:tetratricopeptide (TPR) repeat protein